jgi:hypothetical protein
MFPFLGFVGDVVEDLVRHDGGDGTADLVVTLNVDLVLALLPETDGLRLFLIYFLLSMQNYEIMHKNSS